MVFKKLIWAFSLLLCNVSAALTTAKNNQNLATFNFTLPAKTDTSFYYALVKGDEIVVACDVQPQKAVPISCVFSLYKGQPLRAFQPTKKVETITEIPATGVYILTLSNKQHSKRQLNLVIDRLPSKATPPNYTPLVKWVPMADTTYHFTKGSTATVYDTIATEIYNGVPKLAARWNIGQAEAFQVISLQLPPSTKKWSFYIGAGAEGKAALAEARQAFLKQSASVAKWIPEIGPLVALALSGVSYFNAAKGNQAVNYALFTTQAAAEIWAKTGEGVPVKTGVVISEAVSMNATKHNRWFLVIQNQSKIEALQVVLQAVALTVNTRKIKSMAYSPPTITLRMEPTIGF